MSVGSDIIRRMSVQRYRRNEGDRWPWQDDLAFVTKNGIGPRNNAGDINGCS